MTPKEPKRCAKCGHVREAFYLRYEFGHARWICVSADGCRRRQRRDAQKESK